MYAEDPIAGAGEWPVALELVSLSGQRLSVPFQEDQCTLLLDLAVNFLDDINSIVANQPVEAALHSLANPTPSVCRFCSYRPACPAYRTKREEAPVSIDWPCDEWGPVLDIAHLGNGTVSMTLQVGGNPVRVRGLNPSSHGVLDSARIGDEVAVFSASIQRGTSTIGENQYTALFKLS
jgi:hypothetical protein